MTIDEWVSSNREEEWFAKGGHVLTRRDGSRVVVEISARIRPVDVKRVYEVVKSTGGLTSHEVSAAVHRADLSHISADLDSERFFAASLIANKSLEILKRAGLARLGRLPSGRRLVWTA